MQTRAQASGARSSPVMVPDPVMRPNARRLRKLANHFILNEDRIMALEGKDVLTDAHKQSVMRISKMLESARSEFKAYQYEIMAGLKTVEAAAREQI